MSVDKESNTPLIIFGYAAVGKKIYERIKKEDSHKRVFFCDNSKDKQGIHGGVMVLSLEDVVTGYNDAAFIVASLRHSKQMYQQLIDVGIPTENISLDLPDDIIGEELAREQKQRMTALDSIHVEVNINKDCNLNCTGCDHFAPIAEADTLELDIFKKDMIRLADVMAGHIHRIILLGGEPLLNKDLLEYVRIARICMPDTEVFIATNGILLGKMDEIFWSVLKENKTGLLVTKYPVKLDYDALRKKVEEKGIVWKYLGSSESGRSLWHFPLDLTGKQNAVDSFLHCANANSCHTLERGRLYTCSIAPNIKAFNRFFEKNVPLADDDGIDIYKAKSADEILKFLAKPIHFCRYCNVKKRTYDHPWRVSKKKIEEWTL
ncbi:radical SAM protein [Selenomonas sp. FC4001]|uniref:radical SAM protein n=1 Tax=Selenomonas sp. FC4001 TaxID=1408313 RepID=UPI00068EF8B3|nr:radical SAM protein [Selenomonas sp. FC4001]